MILGLDTRIAAGEPDQRGHERVEQYRENPQPLTNPINSRMVGHSGSIRKLSLAH
jgi:hypothetical protein